jgi:DNA-binding response OmpR family regulator
MSHHILIVDDEAPIREMLKLALAKHGFRVTDAGSATEALRIVRDDPPQLVISDLQLEDTDGMEMIEQLKTALPSTPVILLTGVFFDQQVVEGALAGKVSAYLHKTAPLSLIVEKVRQLVGK